MRITLWLVGLGFIFPSGVFLFFFMQEIVIAQKFSIDDLVAMLLVGGAPLLVGILLCWTAFTGRGVGSLKFRDVRYLLFSFKGRIGRGAFWGVYFTFIVTLSIVDALAGDWDKETLGSSAIFVMLLLMYPWIAIQVKRWHDIDKSGWWVLTNAIPLIGWIIALIANGFMKGSEGKNRFGGETWGLNEERHDQSATAKSPS